MIYNNYSIYIYKYTHTLCPMPWGSDQPALYETVPKFIEKKPLKVGV